MKRIGRLWAAFIILLWYCISLVACVPSSPQMQKTTYTFDEYLTKSPTCWNPFTRTGRADRYIPAYTEPGFVEPMYDSANNTAKWEYEMAVAIEDVTADEPETLQRFGLSGTAGLVWKISLNPNACWEDGTTITAQSYVDSMQLLLDPASDFSGAVRFCTGDAALVHAKDYAENDRIGTPIYESVVSSVKNGIRQYHTDYTDGTALYFSLQMPCAVLQGRTLAEEAEKYAQKYDCFADLLTYCKNSDYLPLTAELRTILAKIGTMYGFSADDAVVGFCAFTAALRTETPWVDVGLYVGDDAYTLYYVCAAETLQHELFEQLSENWLVHPALYAADSASYATSVSTYMGYGPYRLVSADENELRFTRNEKWYGYTDGLHTNQFQTTDVTCRIIQNNRMVLDLFTAGQLDVAVLSPEDYTTLLQYRFSTNLLRTESTYTQRLVYVTDRDALAALAATDPQGGSRMLLHYSAFREAIGWAIDRTEFIRESTVTDIPAFGLFGSAYFADPTEPSAIYRLTDAARTALATAYGLTDTSEDTLRAFTGYDPARAAALFTDAYHAALRNGDITANETFRLRCAVEGTVLTPAQERQQQLLQKYISNATADTPLAERIRIEFIPSETRYEDIAAGRIEMILGAWGGAAENPYSLIRCYTDPTYAPVSEQCGFDPTVETCTIIVNGIAQTKTFYEWGASLNAGGLYEKAAYSIKQKILAGLEQALLETHCFTVLSTDCSAALFSDQLHFAANYHPLSQFGGVRTLRYWYTDAEWSAYVSSQKGRLDYTAAP